MGGVDRITREALADEELTDAEREDYANEDIPLPEVGAEPTPAEDVGPVVEPAKAEPGETEEVGAREEPPEAGGEAAPARAERDPATKLTPGR